MGCVYFVRHGQTVWNVENKICGATDIALTDLDHQQAIETGKKILEEGMRMEDLFCQWWSSSYAETYAVL